MRKILIAGKGGVGKSFFTYILAGYFLQKKNMRVILLDADESNRGLVGYLGFEEPAVTLLDFLGGKKSVKQKLRSALKTGASEPEITLFEVEKMSIDDIPEEFRRVRGNLVLLAVGKIKEPLEGCACPMGVLAREFIRRLELREDEILIVDTEAGVEHFGRGLEKEVDLIIAIAEPYAEALELAERIFEYGEKLSKPVIGVLNKYDLVSEDEVTRLLTETSVPYKLKIPFIRELYGRSPKRGDQLLESFFDKLEVLFQGVEPNFSKSEVTQ